MCNTEDDNSIQHTSSNSPTQFNGHTTANSGMSTVTVSSAPTSRDSSSSSCNDHTYLNVAFDDDSNNSILASNDNNPLVVTVASKEAGHQRSANSNATNISDNKNIMDSGSFHNDRTRTGRMDDDHDDDDDEESLRNIDETTSHSDESEEESSSKAVLAKEETLLVNLSKLLVVAVIVVLAILVGFVTHALLRYKEEKKFQSEYESTASEIISITHIRARSIFDNLESVGVSLTAQARALNATWPFFRAKDFQVVGMVSNSITGANTLTIHPLVNDSDRTAWEEFAVANQDWIAKGHDYDQKVHPRLYQREFYNDTASWDESERWNVTGIRRTIWTLDDDHHKMTAPRADFYAPFWQRAPAADFSPFANQDLHSQELFKGVIQGMLETDHPVMTEVTDATYLRDSYLKRFAPGEKDTPHIYLLSPIYDNLYSTRRAVGFLSALYRFDNFFVNVLPESQGGIVVVLNGSCGQTYSYWIEGRNAIYIGHGNRRDPAMEHMRRDFHIAPFALLEETEDLKYCQYQASVYPSPEWRQKYFSDEPIYYSLAVVACFVVTSLFFVIYDVMVQRRQNKVMDSATKTHAIVSSLYPSTVRERIMEHMNARETDRKSKATVAPNEDFSAGAVACATSERIFGSAPIADHFPAVTIMFGDLVGFTSWSASRQPCDVFLLLETLYHAFDQIARRRRVFKVETVGDCYVAVCGLPSPRMDHAVIMARFAHECRLKMNQLVHQLKIRLGEETEDLALRVGLHSGSVTAGVLRGDKGRFQLFGDAMNTTARIETTGAKDRIHLSQDTADLLIQAGKGAWVIPRVDKVMAKGKGQLSTSWLEIATTASDMSSSGRVDGASIEGTERGKE